MADFSFLIWYLVRSDTNSQHVNSVSLLLPIYFSDPYGAISAEYVSVLGEYDPFKK